METFFRNIAFARCAAHSLYGRKEPKTQAALKNLEQAAP
jgi:hypothetical protein